MNVLHRLHAALVTGGLLVDTQPIPRHAVVRGAAGRLGSLDMTEWRRTVDAVDRLTQRVVRAGLFTTVHEQRFVVRDVADCGPDLLTEVSGWAGTSVPRALAARVAREALPVSVDQTVRLRVLRANEA